MKDIMYQVKDRVVCRVCAKLSDVLWDDAWGQSSESVRTYVWGRISEKVWENIGRQIKLELEIGMIRETSGVVIL